MNHNIQFKFKQKKNHSSLLMNLKKMSFFIFGSQARVTRCLRGLPFTVNFKMALPDICSLKRGNSVKLMKNLVKGPEMRPREFLSLILILTSKTDQEFCSHQFDVNLSSLGQKMAELASFFRNGRVLLVEWR